MSPTSFLARLRERRPCGPVLDVRLRAASSSLLVAILVVVGLIVFDPGAPAARGQAALHRWSDLWQVTGAQPAFLTSALIEWCANVVMFVPIGFLSAGAVPPRWRYRVVPLALAGSMLIETAQQFIPDRVPSAPDVVANTLGAALGTLVLIGAAQRWLPRHRAPGRPVRHAGTR